MNAVLAIDTAAPFLQLAIRTADGGTLVHSVDMPTGQAEALFPALDGLLQRANLSYADLGRIAVTTGPGSFTGLRIGLSAARGLGLALSIPVLGVPSLLAISLSGWPGTEVTVALDARRNEQYVQHFSAPGVPRSEPALVGVAWLSAGQDIITDPRVDIAALATFAATADPALFPPEASYVRGADAKPQTKFRVARFPA